MKEDGVETENQSKEDQSPDGGEVGEGEDQHQDPHSEVDPGEAHRLQLLQDGLRLDGVEHGEDVGQTVDAVVDDRDVGPHLWKQAVTGGVTVTHILHPG